MHALSTKPVLSMYRDPDLDVVVRDVPNGRPTGQAVVLRDDVVVVLPLRWNPDPELEVLLGGHERAAVDHPHVIEAPGVRLAPYERDPFLAARRQLGGRAEEQHLIISDVLAEPEFTSERWHLIAGFNIPDLGGRVRHGRWCTLRGWLADVDSGVIRDAKTVLALLMLQRHVETGARRDGLVR